MSNKTLRSPLHQHILAVIGREPFTMGVLRTRLKERGIIEPESLLRAYLKRQVAHGLLMRTQAGRRIVYVKKEHQSA